MNFASKILPGGQVADLDSPDVGLYRIDELGPTEATLVAIAGPAEPPLTLPLTYLMTSPHVTWLGDVDRMAPSSLPDESILQGLPARKAEITRRRLTWVREIGQAKSGYPSGNPPAQAIHVIAQAAADLGVSARSIYRYTKAYEERGIQGLLDHRAKLAGARPKGGPEVLTLIAQYLHRNRDRAISELGQIREIAIELSNSTDHTVVLSDSTLRRYLNLAKAELGYESTPKKRLNRQRTATTPTRPYVPAAFGELVQLDEHILDIETVDPLTGHICRPRIQVLWETALHVPISVRLAVAPATAIDAGFLLFDALMFAQPMLGNEDEPPRVVTSWDTPEAIRSLVDASRVAPRSRQLFVTVPRMLRSDNASIYQAGDFVDTLTSLGITLIPSRTYRPTDKAHIERFFGTLESELIQHLPGYVGSNAHARPTGKMGPPAELLSVTALEQIICAYLQGVWMDTPRVGMHSVGQAGPDLSPRQALHIHMERTGFIDSLVDPHAALALLHGTYAALSNTMITLKKLKYSNPELGRLRDQPTPDTAHRGRYHVRYDPRDLSGIWVFIPNHSDPDKGHWTYATCRSLVEPMPFSLQDLKIATTLAESPEESRTKEEILRDFIGRVHSGEVTKGAEAKAASSWHDRASKAATDRTIHLPITMTDPDDSEVEYDDEDGLDPTEESEPFEEHSAEWDWLPFSSPSSSSDSSGADS